MNLCPSNAEMLLIGIFSLTGVMQVTQWGQSEYLPVFAQQNLGLSHSLMTAVCSLSYPSPLPSRQKTPEIQRSDLAGPQLFSSTVHPLCLT